MTDFYPKGYQPERDPEGPPVVAESPLDNLDKLTTTDLDFLQMVIDRLLEFRALGGEKDPTG